MAHLDCTKHHTSICVLELGNDALANVLRFTLALCARLCLVPRQAAQDGYSPPLRAFVQRDQKLLQYCGIDDEDARVPRRVGFAGCGMNVCQGRHSIGDNLNERRQG